MGLKRYSSNTWNQQPTNDNKTYALDFTRWTN